MARWGQIARGLGLAATCVLYSQADVGLRRLPAASEGTSAGGGEQPVPCGSKDRTPRARVEWWEACWGTSEDWEPPPRRGQQGEAVGSHSSRGWARALEPQSQYRVGPSVVHPSTGVPMLSVQPKGKQKGCAGCNRKIKDRYLLKALDKYWHEDCLKCACCDCRLGEVGSTLYTKANLILCRRDYLRCASRRPQPPTPTPGPAWLCPCF